MEDTAPTNEQIYEELSRKIAQEYLTGYCSEGKLEYGPLEINCFSICFWVNGTGDKEQKGIYAKIPKIILYKKENEQIMPLADGDRRLAEDEYRSLVHLSRYWRSDDIDVRFVKPLAFLKDYNAIITERFYAKHFFKFLRRCDLIRMCVTKPDPAHDILLRLGTALSKFHLTSMRECEVDVESIVAKIESCCTQLRALGLTPDIGDSIILRLRTFRRLGGHTYCANTLKGFDVRQVFIEPGYTVHLLDPGKMKTDYVEMDLARFIVTCRILYWGSILFFLRMSPDASYEESFLRGYYGNNMRFGKVLCLLTIKELLKHWRMAYTVLSFKPWPLVMQRFLKKTYIDPFYKWQINNELANLEK